MKNFLSIVITAFFFLQNALSQKGTIRLENPSFEGVPAYGTLRGTMPKGWYDCGFPGETAPDLHPVQNSAFGVNTSPAKGKSYLGMVVRDNHTWECVGQQLESPMQEGAVYQFSAQLARSLVYESPSKTTGQLENWASPCKLRIWGGRSSCDKAELLAESGLVINNKWLTNHFVLKPSNGYSHIILEAFYQTPLQNPYNGNLLLDDVSSLVPIDTFTVEGDARAVLDSLVSLPKTFSENTLARFEYTEQHMGTKFKIVFYADTTSIQPKIVADKAFARIAELDNICSDYKEDSELSQLNSLAGTGQTVSLSNDLLNVLYAGRQMTQRSKGTFDYTAGALTKLWRKAIRQNEMPSEDQINKALRTVGNKHVILGNGKDAHINNNGTRIDLGGIAKGYAVDEALKVLKNHGITIALVDGGGDLAVGDPPPGKSGWTVKRIVYGKNGELTTEPIMVVHGAIATSGPTEQFLEADGKRYSHIIDPRSGYGVTKKRVVSVVAPTCMEADAWATALSVEVVTKVYLRLKKRGVLVYFSDWPE